MKILVIDIGGTFIKYAFMDQKGQISERGKVETPQESRGKLIEVIGSLYDQGTQIEGIAIAMPGIIDTEKGYCMMGGALRYNDDFYLAHELGKRCPVKIHIENDAKCAAMAEAADGALKDVNDGFVLIFGTMIGGGFIKDKKLHRGCHFSAGEVSYMATDRDGIPTMEGVWGNRCSTTALCRMYAQKRGRPEEKVDGVLVFDAVNRGEAEAKEVLAAFCREIAVQVFNIQTVLDPQRFAIGGGISAQPVFLETIREELKTLYAACPYYVPQAEIVTCKYQNDANLYGALQCYLSSSN